MKIINFIVIFILSVSLWASEYEYSDDIDAHEAAKMVQTQHALLIDVRDPVEYLYVGHAVGAINIPIFFVRVALPPLSVREKVAAVERQKGKAIHVKKTYRPMMDENDKFVEEVVKAVHGKLDRPVIVMCRSGERSAYAADKLTKNGFENVYNLEDGFVFGWKKAGLPSGGE